MNRGDLERSIRSLRKPEPAEALRERVLQEAATRLPSPAKRPGCADRLWFSRSARWAWGVAIVAALLAEARIEGLIESRFECKSGEPARPMAAVAREINLRDDWRGWVVTVPNRPPLPDVGFDPR